VLSSRSASLAAAMIPTAVPLAAFSSTALADASLSMLGSTWNSSMSLMLIGENLVGEGAVGRGGADGDIAGRAVGFAVDGSRDGHHARVGVDREASAVVGLQAVGDRVGGGIGVGRRGRNAHGRATTAFSLTALADGLASLTAPTSNSSTSLR